MSNHQKITRSDHVASLTLPPGRVAEVLGHLQRADVLLRIGICLFAAVCMWLITGGWSPPFSYRLGHLPARDICARVEFSVPDADGTANLREQKRSEVACTYVHDVRPLQELRSALVNRMLEVRRAESLEKLDQQVWQEFLPPVDATRPAESSTVQSAVAFTGLRAALAGDAGPVALTLALERAFQEFEKNGLLEGLEHSPEDGSQITILVYPLGRPSLPQAVDVSRIQIAEVMKDFRTRLADAFREAQLPDDQVNILTDLTTNWLKNRKLPTTLRLDPVATQQTYAQLEDLQVEKVYAPGSVLVKGGQRVSPDRLEMLRREHAAVVAHRSAGALFAHSAATFGMYTALFLFCGIYVLRHQPTIIADLGQLVRLLALLILTVTLGRLCAGELWQAEIVPVLLFGMTVAIAFWRELALVLTAAMTLILCLTLGMGLAEFVLMATTASAAVVWINPVRSRTKLIYVGLGAGLVAVLTAVGVGVLVGEPVGAWSGSDVLIMGRWSAASSPFVFSLLASAVWHGFGTVLAAVVMTGLLPFIERLFGVQTDIRLLELGDAAHPLLQELARRAPGTYNHSINVASLAEAAAESIGANGLLVRVGSYFHDIGKVFKPGYFVENQGRDGNRHESLVPTMSTLVIIAHVKDGADLAEHSRLPKPIVDFIEQHHGTTLVEYFYGRASEQKQNDPDGGEVEESSFRYPGPKPQIKETAVLMLADAAESACRSLVEPGPARIEALVREIAERKLEDGQFDESGLTLRELRTVEDSMIKSLIANYHGRIKYPDQKPA